MRLDVAGSILLLVGALVNVFTSWWVTEHPNIIVAFLGTFIAFLGWVFIISGATNLWEVRKDKKARKQVAATPTTTTVVSESHLGMEKK